MKKLIILLLLIFMMAYSCNNQDTDRKTISVSITPIEYFVDKISGDEYEVNVIVPQGASPETYDPLPYQIEQLAKSLIYFQIGFIDFEKNIEKNIPASHSSVKTISLGQGLELTGDGCEQHGNSHQTGVDPHIWLSPRRIKSMARKIADELSEINPDNKLKYKANLSLLNKSIDSINTHMAHQFNDLAKDKLFLIYHPFLGYYANDYGLKQIAIEVDGKEPSASQYMEVVKQIHEYGINTIFYQPQNNYDPIKSIVEVTGVTAEKIDPLAYNWIENMVDITDKIAKSLQDE